ncbi:MAG: TspO/MBR family protein [Microbacterium sp.]
MSKPTIRRQVLMGAVLLALSVIVAGLGSLATIPSTDGGWYEDAAKVPWSPPNGLFGPAWSLLYAMIAVAGFLIWRSGYAGAGERNRARPALTVFGVQMALNLAWTPVFFAGYPLVGAAAWWAGMVVIVLLIVAVIVLIVSAYRHSKSAAWLLVPYLGWLLFASTLNAGIIALN